MGGDVIRIWGEGFARLGPQNKVTVAGIGCTPRTLKNFHCRVSQFDSGYECAATSSKGYEMVWHAHASSRDRANAEWLDYSSTTYIECVLDDLKVSITMDNEYKKVFTNSDTQETFVFNPVYCPGDGNEDGIVDSDDVALAYNFVDIIRNEIEDNGPLEIDGRFYNLTDVIQNS
jgi:hypothetical protein